MENPSGFFKHGPLPEKFLARLQRGKRWRNTKTKTPHGITHPIDIQGWNHHPVIRDFIDRILSAEPKEKTIAA
jgi:hypothetical protein